MEARLGTARTARLLLLALVVTLGLIWPSQPYAVQAQSPTDPVVVVRYEMNGNGGVFGWNTPPERTFTITVTESGGTVVATETTTSGWDGNPLAFNADLDPWVITPGRSVTVAWDGGQPITVLVVGITGTADAAADSISGTAPPNSVLEAWIEGGGDELSVPAFTSDGSGAYSVALSGSWDVKPGDRFHVYYPVPGGHLVEYVFWMPTPQLRVEHWAEGQPGEGGNLALRTRYCNEGEAAAQDVTITDALDGMSYLGNSAGYARTGSGTLADPLVFSVDDIEPQTCNEFDVYVEVDALEDFDVGSSVEVGAPNDTGDPSMKAAQWEGQVAANDTYLSTGKWAWTGDPSASGEVVFQVDVCNNGSTSSGGVSLTDEMSDLLLLDAWWADSGGWGEMGSSDHTLAMAQYSVAPGRCESVYVRAYVHYQAQVGAPITNTVTIDSSSDLSGDDNVGTWQGVVGEPRTNLNLNKHFGHGQLTPGGEINYWVMVHNDGNVAVEDTLRITDTLPVSTSLVGVQRQEGDTQEPVTLAEQGAGYVAWELDGLVNGYEARYMVTLEIDDDAVPGTALTNAAELQAHPDEDHTDDNVSSWTEVLNPSGPNLRVHKDGRWDDWGPDTRRASYWLNVENVGDAAVDSVVITDTLPVGMQRDGGVHADYWMQWGWDDHGDYITVELERLEPGWSVGINTAAMVDGTGPLPFGQVYTNTAQVAPPAGDTNPSDNTSVKVLTTGPDLFVEKTLVSGEVERGETLVFSLRFGNAREGNEWWWGMQGEASLTDTLPAGMEYVSAQMRFCGPETWCNAPPTSQAGGQLAWNLWQLGADHWNELLVTVQMADDAEAGAYANTAEIVSDQPQLDVEPFYENNSASWEGAFGDPELYLPMLMR